MYDEEYILPLTTKTLILCLEGASIRYLTVFNVGSEFNYVQSMCYYSHSYLFNMRMCAVHLMQVSDNLEFHFNATSLNEKEIISNRVRCINPTKCIV